VSPLRAATTIGLDIGASAVRLAQVGPGRHEPSLLSFGQIALPPGAVVDGEIHDAGAVSEAIAQLWKRTKIKTKSAVVGVANQGVVVRQLDLPYLEEKELRSSLAFQVADQIPMAVEDAELDYFVVGEYTTEDQQRMMRILLVAAATDMVEGFVSAVRASGVEPAAVDLTPFAIARAVSPAARGESGAAGSEVVVDVGAGVTNILVHQNGEPHFVRILLVGGDDPTEAIMQELGVPQETAEAMKLDLGRGVGSPDARRILDRRVGNLVEEIRGSLDYYSSQETGAPVASVLLTGGGSLTAGLAERLEKTLRLAVRRGSPLSQIDVSRSGLTSEQVQQVNPVAAAVVGLALGAMTR
jgi:type IV pilus assembly protein PilM